MTSPDSGSSSGPMTSPEAEARELALLPLVDAVCFPRTEMRLRISDRGSCRFLRGLFAEDGDEARLGVVSCRTVEKGAATFSMPTASPARSSLPGARRSVISPQSPRPVFVDGTRVRLLRLEPMPGGCEVVLRGEVRIRLAHEMVIDPGHRVRVETLEEPEIAESDPDVQSLRRELSDLLDRVAQEHGEGFAIDTEHWNRSRSSLPFEAMVNHLAANLDLEPSRQLQLLRDPLPDRALHLLTLLRGRWQVLDLLRPFRHLVAGVDTN